MDNLRRRNVEVQNGDYLCPFCNEFEESLNHILFSWKLVDGIWKIGFVKAVGYLGASSNCKVALVPACLTIQDGYYTTKSVPYSWKLGMVKRV